jgi:RNA polymerase sigma-70 factor, ECF subfamily
LPQDTEPNDGLAATIWNVSPVAQNAIDAALLRAVAAGDEAALAELYDRHSGWLLVRLRRRCASADTVDLALQDTFLTLWRNARSYRGQGDVAAFLWGIAIRRLIDAMRAESRALRSRTLMAREEASDRLVQSAEDEVLLGIEHGRLGEALTRLSPELRAAMQATVLDGLTCAEAGRLLGVPAGTVKSRCHRARMQLREALA